MPKHSDERARDDILILSDTHCGSHYGLWPPNMTDPQNNPLPQNKGQEYLWKCWLYLRDNLAKHSNLAAIVFNGDAVDGSAFKSMGHDLTSVDSVVQADAFEESMRVFMQPLGSVPLYCVQGTEYHDAKSGHQVERVAKALGAVRYTGVGSGRYSKEILDLEVNGVVLNFSHGISVSSGFYRATAPDREGVWSALAGKTGKMPPAEVVVRSHAHYFAHVEHESKHILITPCWQLQTRYMRKNSAYRMLPSVGAVLIRVYKEPLFSEDRVRIKKFLYPLPEYKPTRLRP